MCGVCYRLIPVRQNNKNKKCKFDQNENKVYFDFEMTLNNLWFSFQNVKTLATEISGKSIPYI